MDNKEAKHRGPIEMRDTVWWQHGYANWRDKQFKKRLRVNRDTFHFILNNISDQILEK